MTTTKVPPQLTNRITAITYANPIVVDCSKGNVFSFTLAGSPLITAINLTPGTPLYLLIGSGAGGYTPTWDTMFDFGANGMPVLSLAASKVDHVGGRVVGAIAEMVPPSLGYSA